MPQIRVNGIDLNYVDRGDGDVIVLLHNVVSNITALEQNIAVLQNDFRVVACDLRGHGKTTHHDKQIGAREFYTFENISEDITLLLDHLRIERFSLVGQAYWGVSSAAHLFKRHPGRVDAILFAACDLIASPEGDAEPYAGLGEKAVANFERMIALAREQGMAAVYQERLESRTFWGPTVLGSPEILTLFERLHRETSPTAFANFPRFSQRTLCSILDKLQEHRTPAMLLLGSEDSHNSQMIANMRRMLPGIHVALLPFAVTISRSRTPGISMKRYSISSLVPSVADRSKAVPGPASFSRLRDRPRRGVHLGGFRKWDPVSERCRRATAGLLRRIGPADAEWTFGNGPFTADPSSTSSLSSWNSPKCTIIDEKLGWLGQRAA
ncbi:alpha/beta fold hydrolase [Novosphingobium sp. Gsoil 351]|uniref:alpha/beta hydrolase n=1 Tax=Novosphingobium sp. Gsoil 351 TaxID=2675225 RepID=UPI0012B4AE11|nr:alpha/beta hydrolase [Novosphingobium sp. Gsoil 351]QGN53990.1 alpha/beta fold hydrolase [Novosphingobium sp. Gsoil 351]